ncbi:MAG TPA: hypothetical protein VF681_16065 [Abditibacteriaceae bacterium]
MLVTVNDSLTYGDPNAQGSGSLFTFAFLCATAATGIKVWVSRRPK